MSDSVSTVGATVSPPEEVVLDWWRSTIAGSAASTGPRAELRRARTLDEVLFAPLYHDLRHRLRGTRWTNPVRIGLVAGVIARVERHDDRGDRGRELRFAGQMAAGAPGAAERPRVSEARFRRLLRIGDDDSELESLFQLVRRVVSLMDSTVNLTDLAGSLYWWGMEVRKRWALDYYEIEMTRKKRS